MKTLLTLKEFNEKEAELLNELQKLRMNVRRVKFYDVCVAVIAKTDYFTTDDELAEMLSDELNQCDDPFTKEDVLETLKFVSLDSKYLDLFSFVSDERFNEHKQEFLSDLKSHNG